MTIAIKGLYLDGIMDGMIVYVGALGQAWRREVPPVRNERDWNDRLDKLAANLSRYVSTRLTQGQLIAGMDAFYADFRNRLVPMESAAWVVLRQIAGDDQKEIYSDLSLVRTPMILDCLQRGGYLLSSTLKREELQAVNT